MRAYRECRDASSQWINSARSSWFFIPGFLTGGACGGVAPQGANAWRERIAVVLDDGANILPERDVSVIG